MLHMLATLVTMMLLFGAGGIIVISLGDRRNAIAAALDPHGREEPVAPVLRRARVRWSQVKAPSARTALSRYVA